MNSASKVIDQSPQTADEQRTSATKSLVRHGLVYGLGQIALRFASILLLPVYTRYLTPADYGVIALVDVVVGLLGIVVGGHAAAAATRQHFSPNWEGRRGTVWWNGVWFVCLADLIVIAPALLALGPLSALTFGSGVVRGETWLLLGLLTLALSPFEQMGLAYLRAEKRSVAVVVLSIARLLFNIAANLTLLNVLESEVMAVLLGNLLTALLALVLTLAASIWRLGFALPDRSLLGTMWKFSGPLLVTGFASLVMHEAGRYSLRWFADLSDVGVYGLAQQIGQGMNALIIMPFTMIYWTMILEVAARPYANWFYATVFRVFVGILATALLGLSVFAPEIFALLIGPNFQSAVELVPITCLAYFVFSLHTHFSIPAVIAERTSLMIGPALAGAAVTVGSNVLLVPSLKAMGAGLASLLGFTVYSFGGFLIYRRIRNVGFALGELALLLAGIILTFFACKAWRMAVPPAAGFVLPAVATTAWAVFLCKRHKWLNLVSLVRGGSLVEAQAAQ